RDSRVRPPLSAESKSLHQLRPSRSLIRRGIGRRRHMFVDARPDLLPPGGVDRRRMALKVNEIALKAAEAATIGFGKALHWIGAVCHPLGFFAPKTQFSIAWGSSHGHLLDHRRRRVRRERTLQETGQCEYGCDYHFETPAQ